MTDAIKSMKLYTQVERIHRDLESVGIGPSDPLSVDALTPFDQLHYFGTEAVDAAIAAIGPGTGVDVLDVGSGFGGPARYMADRSGCRVTAVELQPDLDRAAAELTGRCGLGARVEHVCGDIHDVELAADRFGGAISYLALYHIPDRAAVYRKIFASMAPGARLYVEDLYQRATPTAAEADVLRNALFANTMTDLGGYAGELEAAGFTALDLQDESDRWGGFCADRLNAFRAVREEKQAVHGAEVVEALDTFYQTMCDLFSGGSLGGVRVIARKPENS
ncbi:MAG: class I SAM-dependent methyltransferase [Pseudomonadota bacterium]